MSFYTDLSGCFLQDSYMPGAAFYDWCPAGGFIMSPGGRVKVSTQMIQHFPARMWKSKAAVDRGIYRLLRKAAESRVGGITKVDVKLVHRFIDYCLGTAEGRQVVCSPSEAEHLRPRLKTYGVDKLHVSKVVPTKLILVTPHAEVMMGWFCGKHLGEISLALRHPELVAGCIRTGEWPEWTQRTPMR
jgi:hypothetical protein